MIMKTIPQCFYSTIIKTMIAIIVIVIVTIIT